MTIEEAKKIIEMCADAVRKNDGDDAKIYVNKEYVLSILDMVETQPVYPWPDYPYPWNPCSPGVTWTDNKFVYKKTTDGTSDEAPGKWVFVPDEFPNPQTPYCTTGSEEEFRRLRECTIADSSQNDTSSVVTTMSKEPTHLYKEEFTTTGKVKDTSEGTHTV